MSPAGPCLRWEVGSPLPGQIPGREPALHPASPAVHRGLPHQDPGGKRHRPALHLRPHHQYDLGSGNTSSGEGKALRPTALGEVTTRLMKEQFPEVVDVEFTANMEQQLDGVEHGKADWVDTLDAFYKEFSKTLERAEENLSGEKIKVPEVESDVVCEQCGRKMVIKSGRYGKFLACPGMSGMQELQSGSWRKRGPSARNAAAPSWPRNPRTTASFLGAAITRSAISVTWSEPTKELCPKCGKTLFKKKGQQRRCCLPDRGLRL